MWSPATSLRPWARPIAWTWSSSTTASSSTCGGGSAPSLTSIAYRPVPGSGTAPSSDCRWTSTYRAIISGLPLNNFGVEEVRGILEVLARLAEPGGTLSFFKYVGYPAAEGAAGRPGRTAAAAGYRAAGGRVPGRPSDPPRLRVGELPARLGPSRSILSTARLCLLGPWQAIIIVMESGSIGIFRGLGLWWRRPGVLAGNPPATADSSHFSPFTCFFRANHASTNFLAVGGGGGGLERQRRRLSGATADKSPRQKDDYYELYKLLADTIDQVERNYVKEVDRRELIEAAIKGVMAELDPYSVYIGPGGVEPVPHRGRERVRRHRHPGATDGGRLAGAQPDLRHARLPRRHPGRRPDRGNRRQDHRRHSPSTTPSRRLKGKRAPGRR